MINYLRESLGLLYSAFFTPRNLVGKALKTPNNELVGFFVISVCVSFLVVLGILTFVGLGMFFLNLEFKWFDAYVGLITFYFYGLFFGALLGVGFGNNVRISWSAGDINSSTVRMIISFNFAVITSVVLGLGLGLLVGVKPLLIGLLDVDFFKSLILGVFLGVLSGIMNGWVENKKYMFIVLALMPLVFLFIAEQGKMVDVGTILIVLLSYFLFYYRFFYLPIHVFQYVASGRSIDPSAYFYKSPICWDSTIAFRLPFLENWLADLVRHDFLSGLQAIVFVIRERPLQRKSAFNALLVMARNGLKGVDSMVGLSSLNIWLSQFPADDPILPIGLNDARRAINAISELSQDYQNRQTRAGQIQVLEELQQKIHHFQNVMKLTVAPVGEIFVPLSIKWLGIIENEQEKLHHSAFNELPNPYLFGSPLKERDQQLFVGRSDILLAIEQYILNTNQHPSLLLYGRRRTGKSSTLLNLPHSRLESVYIDCQDAKWHESDQAFCYNLAHDLFNVLYQSDSVSGLRQPQIEQFDKNAFTQLDQFLTQAQKIAEQRGKRILLAFDEYEALENSIINGDISDKVLGKLRNLIQHSKSIVVLVSGSHRFEELTRLNWANYLINTRTLELSYLDAEPARELLTKPVPELHYEAGVVDDIIRITHCQPYLLQAVASELVNYLNSKQQTTATPDDLNTALEKTLVSASAYFSDTWRKDNSAAEQQVMRALATGKTESVLADAAFQPAIQSLIRKEIVEGSEGSYRLAVELFARWIVRNQV